MSALTRQIPGKQIFRSLHHILWSIFGCILNNMHTALHKGKFYWKYIAMYRRKWASPEEDSFHPKITFWVKWTCISQGIDILSWLRNESLDSWLGLEYLGDRHKRWEINSIIFVSWVWIFYAYIVIIIPFGFLYIKQQKIIKPLH